jgi:hypothetical protein
MSLNRRSEEAFAEKILSDDDLDALFDSDISFEEREKLKQRVAEIDRQASIEEVQRFSEENKKTTELLDKLFIKYTQKMENEQKRSAPPVAEVQVFPLVFPMIEKTIAAVLGGSLFGYWFMSRARIEEVKISPPPAKKLAFTLGTGLLCGCIMAIHQMHKEFDNIVRQANNPLSDVAKLEYTKIRKLPYDEDELQNKFIQKDEPIQNKE